MITEDKVSSGTETGTGTGTGTEDEITLEFSRTANPFGVDMSSTDMSIDSSLPICNPFCRLGNGQHCLQYIQ